MYRNGSTQGDKHSGTLLIRLRILPIQLFDKEALALAPMVQLFDTETCLLMRRRYKPGAMMQLSAEGLQESDLPPPPPHEQVPKQRQIELCVSVPLSRSRSLALALSLSLALFPSDSVCPAL